MTEIMISIAIIGSGAAGLAASHALIASGFKVQIFEQKSTVDGLWNFHEGLQVGRDSPNLYRQVLSFDYDNLGFIEISNKVIWVIFLLKNSLTFRKF